MLWACLGRLRIVCKKIYVVTYNVVTIDVDIRELAGKSGSSVLVNGCDGHAFWAAVATRSTCGGQPLMIVLPLKGIRQ